MSRIKRLPSDFEAILILVETIKNSKLSIEDLSVKLRGNNCNVTQESIRNLFDYHDLKVKKCFKRLFKLPLPLSAKRFIAASRTPTLFDTPPVFDFFSEEEWIGFNYENYSGQL